MMEDGSRFTEFFDNSRAHESTEQTPDARQEPQQAPGVVSQPLIGQQIGAPQAPTSAQPLIGAPLFGTQPGGALIIGGKLTGEAAQPAPPVLPGDPNEEQFRIKVKSLIRAREELKKKNEHLEDEVEELKAKGEKLEKELREMEKIAMSMPAALPVQPIGSHIPAFQQVNMPYGGYAAPGAMYYPLYAHAQSIYSPAANTMAGTDARIEDLSILSLQKSEVKHEIIEPAVVPFRAAEPESGSQVYVGDRITYIIMLHNNSETAVMNVPVKDMIPEGVTYAEGSENPECTQYNKKERALRWVVPLIGPDEEITITYDATVDALTFGQTTRLISGVSYCGNGGGTAENPGEPTISTDEVTHVVSLPPVDGENTSFPVSGAVVKAGQQIDYMITVVNNAEVAINNVPVQDYVPAGASFVHGSAVALGANVSGTYEKERGLVRWMIPFMEPGGRAVLKFSVTTDPLMPGEPSRIIRNVAAVGGCPTKETIHLVEAPALYGIMTSIPANGSKINSNDTITYTITVHNDSVVPIGNIKVREVIPEGAEYISGSAEPTGGAFTNGQLVWIIPSIMARATAVVSFKVRADALGKGELIRTIAASAFVCDIKTNTVRHHLFGTSYYGLAMSEIAPGAVVRAGDKIIYGVQVRNESADPAINMVITNQLPEGTEIIPASISNDGAYNPVTGKVVWFVREFPAGKDMTFTFQVLVRPMKIGINQRGISNSAMVNDTPTSTVTHKQYSPVLSTLKASYPPSGARVRRGDTIRYTIRVINTGLSLAEGINIADYIPAGTTYQHGSADHGGLYSAAENMVSWDLAELDVGQEAQVSFSVTVDRLPDYMDNNRVINVVLVNGMPA